MSKPTERCYFVAQLDEHGLLENNTDQEKIFNVPAGSEVRFLLSYGHSDVGCNPVLLVNKPLKDTYTATLPRGSSEELLEEVKGSQLNIEYLESIKQYTHGSQFQVEFRVPFNESGSFFIQIQYDDQQNGGFDYTAPQFINVEPVLVVGDQKAGKSLVIDINSLKMMTVISRCLGQIDRWPKVFKNIQELGYNVIHFTPFQQYGRSNSHYSLADHNCISDYFFGNAKTMAPEKRLAQLSQCFDQLNKDGMLSLVDIVLNHTADNAKWLEDQPDATYNLQNTPHLYSAWLLDEAIQDFSDEFVEGKVLRELNSSIRSEHDLQEVMKAISKRVFNPLKIHEYFMCKPTDIIQKQVAPFFSSGQFNDTMVNQFKKVFDHDKLYEKDHFELIRDHFTFGHGSGPNPGSIQLIMPDAAIYFYIANKRDKNAASKEIIELLNKLNDYWGHECQNIMRDAYENIEQNIRYQKLKMMQNHITKEKPLVERYFSELKNKQKTQVAHNGYVLGKKVNCLDDFVMTGHLYLRRQIKIWSDNIKMRYGNCPADSPKLWQHMKKYVEDMASVCDGFRLDNAHSTPIHVLKYMLQAARSKNPQLFVMAELFTDSAEIDALFVRELNLNCLVRELQNSPDTEQLGNYFCYVNQCGGSEDLGLHLDGTFLDIGGHPYKNLIASKPNEILYDCSHDNPSIFDKYDTGTMALPLLCLNSVSSKALASTWGYDILVKENIHCVEEERLYSISAPLNGQQKKEKPKQETEFEYKFDIEWKDAKKVSVAGDFNMWKNGDILLRKDIRGVWSVTKKLKIDKTKAIYQYKFIIDDAKWVTSNLELKIWDEHGHENNKINIPGHQTELQPGETQLEDLRYVRQLMNEIHDECNEAGADISIDRPVITTPSGVGYQNDVLVVTRQFDLTNDGDKDSYVSIMRFPFNHKNENREVKFTVDLPGCMTNIDFVGFLEIPHDVYSKTDHNQKEIYGMQGCLLRQFAAISDKFFYLEQVKSASGLVLFDRLHFHYVPQGFTCVMKVLNQRDFKKAARQLNQLYELNLMKNSQLLKNVHISGLNHLLYRCENEEKDITAGKSGNYGLNEYGSFPYAGIASVLHIINNKKNLGRKWHNNAEELFKNVKGGDWLLDYTLGRLQTYQTKNADMGFQNLINFMEQAISLIKVLPKDYKPKYVSKLFEVIFYQCKQLVVVTQQQNSFLLSTEDQFLQMMALSTHQFYGRIDSFKMGEYRDSMCAGLTHFSTGFARCWGRDTMIALRGLLVVTGQNNACQETIQYFAKVMRHGLIPNLHDGGNNTRFNARDATWFFLQGIKDYLQISAKNMEFLTRKEMTLQEMQFHSDDQTEHYNRKKSSKDSDKLKMSILDVILHILKSHANGIKFREWNAGSQIDAHMRDGGFNIDISTDLENTGFCFGGNKDNCGTWMDKMGSSDFEKNRGVPATPRDGAPIELVAMQYSVLSWLAELSAKGVISQKGVKLNNKHGSILEFKSWADKIKSKFEECFWIPKDVREDSRYKINAKFVNRRGIYKDVYKSSQEFPDYQLRPNLCIAMSYAPELFDKNHAKDCLEMVEAVLMEKNCMGIKTLDPEDYNYRGDYVNDDGSHGWNYHQGPEWVWPVGFFLKALLIFRQYKSQAHANQEIMKWLQPHKKYILAYGNAFEGLPELTNANGKICHFSCETQAWSVATLLDAMRDLSLYKPNTSLQDQKKVASPISVKAYTPVKAPLIEKKDEKKKDAVKIDPPAKRNSVIKKPVTLTPVKKDEKIHEKKPVTPPPAKKAVAKYINTDKKKLSHYLGTYQKEIYEDVDKLWGQFDVDKNNALDRDEALLFVKKVSENMVDKTRKQNFNEANFHKIFSDFDEDHNGFLVQAEMAVLIKQVFKKAQVEVAKKAKVEVAPVKPKPKPKTFVDILGLYTKNFKIDMDKLWHDTDKLKNGGLEKAQSKAFVATLAKNCNDATMAKRYVDKKFDLQFTKFNVNKNNLMDVTEMSNLVKDTFKEPAAISPTKKR